MGQTYEELLKKVQKAAARKKRKPDKDPDPVASGEDPGNLELPPAHTEAGSEGGRHRVETAHGAREREKEEARRAQSEKDESVPRQLARGLLNTGPDVAGAVAGLFTGAVGAGAYSFGVPTDVGFETGADAVSGGFRRNVTDHIAGEPQELPGQAANIIGENLAGAIPGVTAAQRAGKLPALARTVAGPGRRALSARRTPGRMTDPESARFATGMELASAGSGAAAQIGTRAFFDEPTITEGALATMGGFAPSIAGITVRGARGGARSLAEAAQTGRASEQTSAGEFTSKALDEGSLALREGGGIIPDEAAATGAIGIPMGTARARLREGQRLIDDEGVPATFGTSVQGAGALDLDRRLARTSQTYAAHLQELYREGATGIQRRVADAGAPLDVDAREAARAAAGASVERSIARVEAEVDDLNLDEVGRAEELTRRMQELWKSQKVEINERWEGLETSAAQLEGQTIGDGFPELARIVDDEGLLEALFPSGNHPASLMAAIKRKILGRADKADEIGSAAEDISDWQLILGDTSHEFDGMRRAAASGADVEDLMPEPGSARAVILLRKRLNRMASSNDRPTQHLMIELKKALDEDVTSWANAPAGHTGRTSDFADEVKDVNGFSARVYEKFRDGFTGRALGIRGSAPGDSEILDFYTRTPDRAKEFLAKFPEEEGTMVEHLIVRAYNATAGEPGIPNASLLRTWLRNRNNRKILKLFPEARERIGNVEVLAQQARELGVYAPRSREAVNRGAVSMFIDDPARAFDRIFEAANPGKAATRLVQEMGSREAQRGLQSEFWSIMSRRFTREVEVPLGAGPGLPGQSQSIETVNPAVITAHLRDPKWRSVAVAIMGPRHVKNIETLAGYAQMVDLLPHGFHTEPPTVREKLLKVVVGSGVLSQIQRPALRTLRFARLIDRIGAVATGSEVDEILRHAMTNPTFAEQLMVRTTRPEAQRVLLRMSSAQRTVAPRVWAQVQAQQAQEEEVAPTKTAPAPRSRTQGL